MVAASAREWMDRAAERWSNFAVVSSLPPKPNFTRSQSDDPTLAPAFKPGIVREVDGASRQRRLNALNQASLPRRMSFV